MMKFNPVKRKLREGKPTFGVWLSLDNLHTARLLAQQGMQFISVCSEARMLAMKAQEIAQRLGFEPDASAIPAY